MVLRRPLTSLEALPFEQQELLWLLGVDQQRDAPDEDFDRFGWARAECLWLAAPSRPARPVRNALLVALHNADEPPEDGRAFELEFDAEIDGEELSYVMDLRRVLEAHVTPLLEPPGMPFDVVLALCNPHGLVVEPPTTSRPVQWHWARGDVQSWLEQCPNQEERLVLEAGQDWTSTLVEPTLSP